MFFQHKSKAGFYVCLSAGAAMFYDFVYQCVSCYNYAFGSSRIALNYLIPLCLSALSALLCASYFLIISAAFITDRYDVGSVKLFHLVPVFRHLFAMLSALSVYKKGIYETENALYSAVLIFGALFFVFFAVCMDSGLKKVKSFCFLGFSYAVLCFALFVLRISAAAFGADITQADFSSAAYLFTGIFAAFISAKAIEKDKKKDN